MAVFIAAVVVGMPAGAGAASAAATEGGGLLRRGDGGRGGGSNDRELAPVVPSEVEAAVAGRPDGPAAVAVAGGVEMVCDGVRFCVRVFCGGRVCVSIW